MSQNDAEPSHGSKIEVVTVFHNDVNRELTSHLIDALAFHEPDIKIHAVDNTRHNRGFAKACNLGAVWCEAPIVGFLNPDVDIRGPFAHQVTQGLAEPGTVIVGNGFNKPERELRIWGIKTFVCGACLFVDREWFESVDGFDQRFVWSHEETDLIRRAETDGLSVRELRLPIRHSPPGGDSEEDKEYKRRHFDRGARLYRKKWTGHEYPIRRSRHGRY